MGTGTTTDDLVADFFGGPAKGLSKREAVAMLLDECIEDAKRLDGVAQNVAHALHGTFGMGGLVLSGTFDKDGAEMFRWLRETLDAMSDEDLEGVELA